MLAFGVRGERTNILQFAPNLILYQREKELAVKIEHLQLLSSLSLTSNEISSSSRAVLAKKDALAHFSGVNIQKKNCLRLLILFWSCVRSGDCAKLGPLQQYQQSKPTVTHNNTEAVQHQVGTILSHFLLLLACPNHNFHLNQSKWRTYHHTSRQLTGKAYLNSYPVIWRPPICLLARV